MYACTMPFSTYDTMCWTLKLHAVFCATITCHVLKIWRLKMDYNGIMISGCVAVFVQECVMITNILLVFNKLVPSCKQKSI